MSSKVTVEKRVDTGLYRKPFVVEVVLKDGTVKESEFEFDWDSVEGDIKSLTILSPSTFLKFQDAEAYMFFKQRTILITGNYLEFSIHVGALIDGKWVAYALSNNGAVEVKDFDINSFHPKTIEKIVKR